MSNLENKMNKAGRIVKKKQDKRAEREKSVNTLESGITKLTYRGRRI